MNVIFENSSLERCLRLKKVKYEILIPSSDFRYVRSVALYSVLERFEYHISINNVSVGKCLSHSTRYIKHLQRETTHGRLFQDPNCRCRGL